MDTELAFRIGRTGGASVVVTPYRRESPEIADYGDGNWLLAAVTVTAGAFHGSFEARLRTDEFARLRQQLRILYEKVGGRALFEPMEPWLRIEIHGDGRGHFEASCRVTDAPGIGNVLTFATEFDQTDLRVLLKELDALCDAFPIVGTPPARG